MERALVIIPTYNELENIRHIIDAVMVQPERFHLLVVDDNSPDGTARAVEQLLGKFGGRLNLLKRKGKLGLGTAYIRGFKWGINEGFDYILEMDADFSHNPNDLGRLYKEAQEGIDVVVGSRYVRGGSVKNWPKDRLILSYGASLYVRMITGMSVKDPTAGFICYNRRVLEKIDLDKIKFIGYAFQIEMKYAAHKLGFKIKEVPITFVDRLEGNSKMTKGIVHEAVVGVLQMRFKKEY